MKSKNVLCISLMGLFLMGMAVLGYAQTTSTGNLEGKVVDTTGAVLPGVTVTISSPAMILPQMVSVTTERGSYRFPAIPPGLYTVSFELEGFTTLVREEIRVSLGVTITLNVTLDIATLEEVITVTGETPLVDVKSTKIGNVFDKTLMDYIPGARHVFELMNQTPGLRPSELDVGGSTFGTQWGTGTYGLGGQNRIMFDGIQTTEGSSSVGMYMDFGAFEEVQISTASHKAEMPHPGKMLQVIMKSGGNEFHGHFYFDYEGSGWQGDNVTQGLIDKGLYWSDLNNNGTWDTGEAGLRLDRHFEFNAGIGGPIMKDKLWFYFNDRYRRYARFPTGVFYPDGRRGREDTWLDNQAIKATWQLTDKDKIVGVFERDYKEYPYRGASANVPPDSARLQKSPTYNFKVQWTRILSPNTFIDETFGRYYYWWKDLAYSLEASTYDYDLDLYGGCIWARGEFWRCDDGRWQNMFAVSHYRDDLLGGDHDFKFGFDVLNEFYWRWYGGWPDDVRLRTETDLTTMKTTGYRVDILGGPQEEMDRLWNISGYVDDAWSIGDRLTLNLGLRFDYYGSYFPAGSFGSNTWSGVPHPVTGEYLASPAASFPASGIIEGWTPISPRAGLIYDLTGDGRTALKASYGRYYHNPSYDLAYYTNPVRQEYNYYYWNDLNQDAVFDGIQEIGRLISRSGGARSAIDPDIAQPHTDEFVVQLERELITDYSLRVGYVYKNIRNAWDEINIGRYPPEQNWGAGLFEPVTSYDPGPDGATGTADDVGPITLYNLTTVYPSEYLITNYPNFKEHWDNFEVTLIKRMSKGFQFNASWLGTWNHDYISNLATVDQNEALEGVTGYDDTLNWCLKFYGSYQLPEPVEWVRAGWNLNMLSGTNWARSIDFRYYYDDPATLSGAHLFNQGTVSIHPDKWGTEQYDVYTLLNIRFDFLLDKILNITRFQPTLIFELSNVFNTNTILASTWTSGSRFNRPSQIPMPRVFKLGININF